MRPVPQNEAEAILNRLGAVRAGFFHFVGKAGDHLGAYVQKEVPTSLPRDLRVLAGGIAWNISDLDVEVVASPELGAIGLGLMVAEELGVGFAIIEKVDAETMEVKRPAFINAVKGKRVAIVEDVVTKGESTRQAVEAITRAGGTVVVVAALYNRSGQTAQSLKVLGFIPLIDRRLEDFPWDDCNHCRNGLPIVLNIGHGADFREARPEVNVGYINL